MVERVSAELLTAALRLARRSLDELAARTGTSEASAAVERANATLDLIGKRLHGDQTETDHGLNEVGDAIFKLASLDFSQKLSVTGDGSVLDGIRGCVNMLAEELGESHRELVRAKVLAEQAAVAKSEFLSNMSHELRTPMHAILNYTEMALTRVSAGGDIDRAKLEKYLTNMRVSGQRLLSLINDLLDLSKLEAGKMRIVPIQGDLGGVIQQVLAELDSLFKARSIEAVIRRDTADTNAFFDFSRMVQVLDNVVGNSLKFATRGSTMEIALREGPGVLQCSVYNEGPSIPEGELEEIFDRFVQSSKVRNGAGGTGLGLAICRATLDAQGGRIWAENTGPGVTFHMTIPRRFKDTNDHGVQAPENEDRLSAREAKGA